jgi:diguanylate cyclase (GGDEF)-like protein
MRLGSLRAKRTTTARPGRGRFVVFAVTAACGVLATVLAAHLQVQADEQARRGAFGRDAEAAQQRLGAMTDDLVAEFQAGLDYIGATHPQPPGQYADYFRRQLEFENEYDPGIFFVEKVARADIEALERRERAFGVDGFQVISMAEGPPTEEAFIITRSGQEVTGQYPLNGFDVTPGAGFLFIDELPEDGPALRVNASQAILAFSTMSQTQSNLALDAGAIPGIVVFLGGEVRDSDGVLVGWAFRFLGATELTARVGDRDNPAGLNLRFTVEETKEPLLVIGDQDAEIVPVDGLYELRSFETATQYWTLEVWAADDYWPVAGMLDRARTWLVGLGLSLVAATLAAAWWTYRHRLKDKDFELEHARTLATTDGLTGLLNRQGFIDTARARPVGAAATLLFIDLDGFKAINDRRGHDAGDRLLVEVAGQLRGVCRTGDLIARLGGDEFVILTDSVAADPRELASRIVDRVSAVDTAVGCSVGVAASALGAETDVKVLIRLADQRMYTAKRQGGNRFTLV